MDCVGCCSAAVTERPVLTAQGYRRFRCRDCGKQFNERSDGVLSRASLPSDIHCFRGVLPAALQADPGRSQREHAPAGIYRQPRVYPIVGGEAVAGDGRGVAQAASRNNRLEQDHRGIKGRIRCMRGFKKHDAADRFCREHDELRNFRRSRSRHKQYVPATRRRRRFLRHARIAIGIMRSA
jgi:DDE domain